jgi:hypothetical protein
LSGSLPCGFFGAVEGNFVAAELLPIFEKEPRGWGALAFFRRSANPNQSLSRYFADWRSSCPHEFQQFVAKLAAVFKVET